jgi:hypothetical protein
MGAASSLTDQSEYLKCSFLQKQKNILIGPVLVVIKDLDIWNMSNETISISFSLIFDIFFLKIKNVSFILLFLSLRYLTACRASRRRDALQWVIAKHVRVAWPFLAMGPIKGPTILFFLEKRS